jgi:flavodoxin
MKALVVYESMFGNTRQVAEAIAADLGESVGVETAEVSQAPRDLGSEWI